MALTPGRVHVGPVRIYAGVTAGATGNPPTYITHTAGAPATGTELGLTEGETTFTYKTTKQEIAGEQLLAPVDVFVTKEEASVSFSCKEQTYIALQQAFDNVGKEDIAGGMAFWFGAGTSIQTANTTCLFMSSVQRNALTKFLIIVLYKAYNPEGFVIGVSKSKEAIYKVTMTGLADTTRNAGDQIGYYRWEK